MNLVEFHNVLDSVYGAYVVSGVTSRVGNSAAPQRDEAVATIREFLRGNTAAIYQSAREMSTAVSIVQMFASAAHTIGDKLEAMEGLAKKATSPDYSRVQVEQMQKEFQDLAGEINQIAKSTTYDFNKVFSGAGESISINVGEQTKIDIFARDLTFNGEVLDLTADVVGAQGEVIKAGRRVNEYVEYLDRQAGRLAEVTAVIESELEAVVEVESSDFRPDSVRQIAAYAEAKSSEDISTLLETQANVDPERALRLLADRI